MKRKDLSGRLTTAVLVAALLVAFTALTASLAVTAYTAEISTHYRDSAAHNWKNPISKAVVYDNGMNYEGLGASQYDANLGLDPIMADDFILDADAEVSDVHWIGGYWNGPPDDGDFGWDVVFYDDYPGKPGTAIGTFSFTNAEVNETFISGTPGGLNFFSYSVDLPTPISLQAGTKYWISIQGIGLYPPQSGWAFHETPMYFDQAKFKSVYFGYPDWVNSALVFGYPVDMCFQLTGPDWPNHKMHFPQLPDLIGWDVNATMPVVLADDWQCSETGSVTDIHFWGSWKNMDGDPATDEVGQIQFFQFGIWSNLPVGHPQNPFPYSIPGTLLWSTEEWVPGTPTDPPTLEAWYDPWMGAAIPNDHVPYWQYDFVDIPQPFVQQQDSIYWLSISAVLVDPQNFVWGWKNSRDHFEDDAVYMSPTGMWVEMYEPPRSNRFSVYFDPAGMPMDQGSTNYYGQGWYYYEMFNWWNMWFYDNPFTYEHPKEINLDMMIEPVGPVPMVQFAINWSTDLWSMEGEPGRPPLPEDEWINPGYIGRQEFEVYPGPNQISYTLPYNPEWVSIDFRAQEVVITGMINHECMQTSMDLAFVITGQVQEPDLDFGDAPDPSYPTLLANDGARHQIVPGIFLGSSIDAETDGQPDPNALGDDNNGIDDEDGVVFTSLLMPGYQAKVKITASVAAPIDAWIDFNADGDWNDAGEQIFNSVTLSAGANNLSFGVPATAVPGLTISRFRFSTMGGLAVTGLAPDGEVEDHQVAIVEPIGDIKMEYPQLPDLEGWDVLATNPLVLADDWLCIETGPVTDLHFWGSWLNDLVAPINGFWISIHSDIPGPPFSRPGAELWSAYITNFHQQPVATGEQGWFDPYAQFWQRPNHFTCFQYDIDNIPDPFIQEQGNIYWLKIRADVPGAAYPGAPLWGWKTSIQHFADDGTWSLAEPPYTWVPLTDPETGITLDMAFVITGHGCTPSIDVEKKVWDENLQNWVDSTDMDVCNNVDFRITILNDGTCDLTNIIAEDFMDSSLEFVDATPPPDTINPVPGGTYLEWRSPGPLPAGSSLDIIVTAHVLGPVCHLDSNFVFAHASYEPQAVEVTDQDVAYVHATGEEWPDSKMHYPQLPDPQGWDIVSTMGYGMHPGMVTADDFMCMKSGPITGIHFWGSWLYDMDVPIAGFFLSIHQNIPGPPSMPGAELWSTVVTDFDVTLEGQGEQGWYDPNTFWWQHPNHALYFRYDVDSIPEPFYQDSGTIYWLNIMADIGPPGYQGLPVPEPPLWGWKTSRSPHFEDDAVWSPWVPPGYAWVPLEDPRTGITLDLAFVITGGGGQPVLCGDVNHDGVVNVGDAIYVLNYLFKHGGAPIPYLCVGDVNNDNVVNVGDAIYILNYLFKHGTAPDPNCCNPPWAAE